MAVGRYIAGKDLKIGTGIRHFGEDVPEAHTWKNVGPWVKDGSLIFIAGELPKPSPFEEGDREFEREMALAIAAPVASDKKPVGRPRKPAIDKVLG